MRPKELELLHRENGLGLILVREDVTWMDFRREVEQMFEESGGQPGSQLSNIFYHLGRRAKSVVMNETEWREFKEHIDECPECAAETPLSVLCNMQAPILKVELVSMTGPLGIIETRREGGLDELLRAISNSRFAERRRVQVVNGATPLTNRAAWIDFLRNLPPAPQVPRLTCIFSEPPPNPRLQRIEELELGLRQEPPDIDTILSLPYEALHLLRDERLYTLFVQVFVQVLENSTPAETLERYAQLGNLGGVGHGIQEALADLAFTRSEGRSFTLSPKEWQEDVPVEDIWHLLHADIVTYDQLSLGLRLKLNDIENLRRYLRTHPRMASLVPRSLQERLFQGPSIHSAFASGIHG